MPQWPLGSKTKLGWRCCLFSFFFPFRSSWLCVAAVFCVMLLFACVYSQLLRQMASRVNVVDVRRLNCVFVYITPTWVNACPRRISISEDILKIYVPQGGKKLFFRGARFSMIVWSIQWRLLRFFAQFPPVFSLWNSGSCVAPARKSESCCFKVLVMNVKSAQT